MNHEPIYRHKRIALQFSGGKDSLVVLLLLESFWPVLTVYYTNSGEALPETVGFIHELARKIPHFVEIQGKRKEIVAYPTDLLPTHNSAFGKMMGGKGPTLIDRYTCCAKSIMQPMHEQMLKDNITLIIRGQRNADALKPPITSGTIMDGFEVYYPIEDWSDEQVFAFLSERNMVPRYYSEGMTSAPDCLHCTAWTEHKLVPYLRKYHPKAAETVQERLKEITAAVTPVYQTMMEAARGN